MGALEPSGLGGSRLMRRQPRGTRARPRREGLDRPRGRATRSARSAAASKRLAAGRPKSWWRRGDLNSQPPPCKGGALPVELRPRGVAGDQRDESEVASRHSAVSAAVLRRRRTAAAAPRPPARRTASRLSGRLDRFDTAILPRCVLGACVGLGGLEPPASSLSGMRSNRLSYRPVGDNELYRPYDTRSKRVRLSVRTA